jgi:ABC-type multidrug transport system permease subunit
VKREVEMKLYGPAAYFFSKLLADIPFQVFFPAIFVCIVFWGMNLGNVETFFAFMGVVIVASNAAIGVGYCLSALVPSVGVALALGPPVIMPFMIFGGLFVNTDSVPLYFKWLENLSFVKYGYQAAAVSVWMPVDTIDCEAGELCLFSSGSDVLANLNFDPDHLPYNVGILCAMLVGFRFLAFCALYWTLTRSK